jgi:hypothetical protein
VIFPWYLLEWLFAVDIVEMQTGLMTPWPLPTFIVGEEKVLPALVRGSALELAPNPSTPAPSFD